MRLFRAAAEKIGRVARVRSARGVSFALTALSFANKPLGYARMLIIAWAFGTSPAMDAFHIASGIITLISSCVGSAVQNAVMPEIERLRGAGRPEREYVSLFVLTAWAAIIFCVLMCAAFAIAPGVIVRLFAGGFDDERISIGAVMMLWLIPYAAVTTLTSPAGVWAVIRERYTLPSITSFLFNTIAIPCILITAPMLGERSVALSMSIGHVVPFAVLLFALRGVPLSASLRDVPRDGVLSIAKNASFVFILTGLGSVNMVVDRYFASLLPSGAVASISYGGTIIMVVTTAAAAPMLFFLSRISRLAGSDPAEARAAARTAMAVTAAYFLPVGIFMSACARPIVSLLYGWGSFGEESVGMTSSVLAAYSIGMVFAMMSTIISNCAIACGRLRDIVVLSAAGVALNAALDWLLVRPFGLIGLAAATSASQIIGFVITMAALMRELPFRFLIETRTLVQAALIAPLAAVSYFAGAFGGAAQIAAAALLAVLYLAATERLGLLPEVPAHWRPAGLVSFIISSLRSYAGGGR